MPILAKDNRRDFAPAPEGLHQGVCIDVVDLGIVKSQWGEKHQVEIRWQLVDLTDDVTGLPFMVLRRYTLSLNEKAKLRAHLEAWRGRKFTAEELEGFDLEKLIGVNCQIQVVHDLADDGRTWANVSAVVPLGKGMTKVRPSDTYIRVVDREKKAPTGNGAAPANEDEAPF
jgi:hypothetical protein